MNRQDLIDAIAAQTETSKAATGRLLDTLIQIIQSEVARGGVVKLNGFGTFEKTSAAARTGRHPLTGGPVKIPSTCKPKFTPGTTFKELVKIGEPTTSSFGPENFRTEGKKRHQTKG